MVVAVITARANSKGLPGKNMMDLGGKPLIEHSMDIASRSGFDAVLLSTDIDEAIELAANRYPGIEVPFKRPEHLCTDTATHVEIIDHLLEYFNNNNRIFDHLVLLQPTTPFRTVEEMNRGIGLLKGGATSVIGVAPVMHHPADYLYKDNEGKVRYLMPEFKSKRRQEFPPIYFNNGAFYGCSVEFFRKKRDFYDEDSEFLIMEEKSLIDIDTAFDMKLARALV